MTKNSIKPIFIFSLPRSGSTLLQKLLATHNKIFSISEPWILLPFCYATKKQGIITEYDHKISQVGIQNFIKTLPQGKDSYYNELNKFIKALYELHANNTHTYFLDKTPRYYLIVKKIAEIFPDGKFIFLFRNPLAVFASYIETWGNGKLFKLTNFKNDLYKGPKLLTEGFDKLKNRSAYLKYEDLVAKPKKEISKICAYLEINYNNKLLHNFKNTKLVGKLGDQNIDNYQGIEQKNISKWKRTFDTPLRKMIASKYLDNLGKKTIETMGFNFENLKALVGDLDSSFKLNGDILALIYNKITENGTLN